jgi:precorrin-6B methylase 2
MNLDILRGMVSEIKPQLIVHTGCGRGAITHHLATQVLSNKQGFVHCCDSEQDNVDIIQQRIADGKGRFKWAVKFGLGPALISEIEGADFYIIGSRHEVLGQVNALKPADKFFLVTDQMDYFNEISKSRFWYGIVRFGGMAIFQK